MFSFKGFFTQENTHLEHLEDDIINNVQKGKRNQLSKRKRYAFSTAVNMTVKWTCACYNLYQSRKMQVFVSTKSVFNKNS